MKTAHLQAFYCDLLGFDVVAPMPSALFASAGGYHHHIGLNTWLSRRAAPAPAGTAGLRFFTLDLPNEEARRAVVARIAADGVAYTETVPAVVVRDPWQNTILLRIGIRRPGRDEIHGRRPDGLNLCPAEPDDGETPVGRAGGTLTHRRGM